MSAEIAARGGTRRDRARLPLLFQMAALGGRLAGSGATRAFARSPLSMPLRALMVRGAPEGMTEVEICGGALRGLRMRVDLSCEKYYWLGTHEAAVQGAIADRVRPGMTAYDVGAHAGFLSLLMSRCAGPTGQVVAFEPFSANVERLRANLGANRIHNTDVRAIAVSDIDGEVPFGVHASTLEGAIGEPGAGMQTIAVQCATIDGLVAGGLPAPDFIKIDVEGAEGRALRGTRDTISTYLPDLLVEVHSRQAGREVLEAVPSAYHWTPIAPASRAQDALSPGHHLGIARKALA
jgi:FkbM family methyltransferase